METQKNQLVTMRVADMADPRAKGSKRGYLCAHCDQEVWISGHGQEILATQSDLIEICCSDCATNRFDPEDYIVMPPSEETMREVAKATGVVMSREALLALARRRLTKKKSNDS